MPTEKTCPTCGKPLTDNALMGLCPDCLLQAGFGTMDTRGDAVEKSLPFVPPTPAELARYFPELEIIELLGRGGMGAVYKARQKRLQRLVALKILPPNVGQDPSFADRFEREAKALAQLHHPNIVTLYDSGQVDGLFYFFMEFVDGVNLRQLLDTGHVSPKEALAIVPQICDALQFAHDRGIIHRDIKPENILLNKEGRVKIADFGVAKIVARELLESARGSGDAPELGRTKAGKVIGTPQYMAPEQLSHPLDVDNRADIYGLGVVFYQMLTGELPSGKFAPPSRKVQIDVRLDEVVLRALEKKPELRYQQARAIKTHLETIALNRTSVGSNTPSSTAPRQSKRLVLVVRSAAGIFLLGALGVTIFLRFIRDIPVLADGTTTPSSSVEARRGIIEAELEQARAIAAQQEREYEAGMLTASPLEFQASKDKVEILEAELTGDPTQIAKARLLAAQRQFKITSNLYNAGMLPGPNPALDYEKAKGEVAIAEAQVTGDPVQIAQARISAAQRQFEITSNMYKAGALSLSDYQKAEGEVTLAEAQLREVEPKTGTSGTASDGATNTVSVTRTTATKGDIGVYITSLGSVMPPGSSSATSPAEEQPHHVPVTFTIPEDDVQTVVAKLDAKQLLKVEAYGRDMKTKIGEGALVGVDNQIDASTGLLTCKGFIVPPGDTILLPNMFLNIRLLVEMKHGVTLLPVGTIQYGNQGTFVYLITPDHTVTIRQVTIGIVDANMAEIKGGLSPGETVVLDVPAGLREGSQVR